MTWLSVGIRQPLDERDHCFERAVGMHPGLAIHRTRAANRRIPVMRLDPA